MGTVTREDMIDFLKDRPVEIGKKVGFTKLTELHNEWLKEFVFGSDDFTLQAHRGSYKTTCISIALALLIILKPSKSILFMRKTDSDTKEIVNQTKKILESDFIATVSRIIWGVPVRLLTVNQGEINTNYNIGTKGISQLVAQGSESSLTGKHFDIVFTDDIVNLEDRYSAASRERTKRIYQELQNIRNEGGRIVNTGTPWHVDDCFTVMPNIHRFTCYDTGLMTEEEIEQKKNSMTRALFSANYELKHIADEDALFKNPQIIKTDEELLRDGFCHIDASYGGGDSTAFTIIKKKDGKFFVLGKLWESHVDNCIPEILKLKEKYMVGKTYCEDNGDKGYLKKMLKSFGDNVSSYHENMNKFIKISTFLYKHWKNIFFLDSTDQKYIAQVENFSENAEHDDAPDSLASILRKIESKVENGGENEAYVSPFF